MTFYVNEDIVQWPRGSALLHLLVLEIQNRVGGAAAPWEKKTPLGHALPDSGWSDKRQTKARGCIFSRHCRADGSRV
jgi:hypothetical protein